MASILTNRGFLGISVGEAALAAVSGLLLTLSFPKLGWDVLVWVALVPFFYAIKNKSSREGFALGFLMGLVHYSTLLYWIAQVMEIYGHLPIVLCWTVLLLLVAYMGLYPAALASVICQFQKRPHLLCFLAPLFWTALEYVRAFLLSGFPWENLGYSQYGRLNLIQISDILGVYGVSALIVAVNAVLFDLWDAIRQKRALSWQAVLAVFLVASGFFVYGGWRIAKVDTAVQGAVKRKVALVQGNIDQAVKWEASFQGETLQRYKRLSLAALEARPDLVVWPETALPFYFLHDEALTAQVTEVVRASKAYFVVGSPSFRRVGQRIRYYNSAYLLAPSGEVLGKYDKVHLVPYGEYVPLKRFFPFLGKMVGAVGDFESGKTGQTLLWEDERLGVLICFEVIFPELSRRMAQNGAQMLINITNDAWFGTSSAPYQHLSMAVFRAVENHRSVARAANTGISAFIDPVGRRIDETPLFVEAIRIRRLPVMDQVTFYARYGDIFAISSLLISMVICIRICGKAWLSKSKLI